jgi:glyoxylase-like metal-dependent hydrolase (beta-lactamase superfamily II)
MLRSFLLIVILFLFTGKFQLPSPSKDFSIQQLAPGVWAAIQNDKSGHAISNAGIVDLGGKTLVFDAFISPDPAAELRQIAQQLTGQPVSYVINSHYHDDHIRGDQAFAPAATIISTEWTRNEMEKVEPGEREWAKQNIERQLEKARQSLRLAKPNERDEDNMWLKYYEAISQSLPKLKMTLPGLTFKDSMWIRGSLRSVLLVECHNGHTASDAVMILPRENIAFMGDLLFVKRHPWFGDGDPDSLREHLLRFYNDSSVKQFVPGHGAVAGKESLQLLIQYIADLQQMATDAVKNKEPDSVFEKRPVLPAYKDWWFGRFYSDNLEVVYEKAKQEK